MSIPLYKNIQNYIKGKITSGQWEPGFLLPTEKELSSQFGVSRITVTTALRELVKDGIIYRIQGKGTFVASVGQSTASTAEQACYDSVASMQIPGEHRCLSLKRRFPSFQECQLLNLSEKQVIIAMERSKITNGKPSFIERFYLPAQYYLNATDEQLGSLHMSELAKVCDLHLGKNIVSSEAIMGDPELRSLLQLEKEQPVLHTTLEIFNIWDELVAYIEVFNSTKQKQVFTGGSVGL